MDLKICLLYLFLRSPVSLSYGVSLFTSKSCRQCNRFNRVYNDLVESYPDLDFQKIYLNETNRLYVQKQEIKSIPILLFGEGKDTGDRILGIYSNYDTIKRKCEFISKQEKIYSTTSTHMKTVKVNKPITPEHLEAAKLCKSVYDDTFLRSCEEFIDHPETDVQVGMLVERSTLIVCFRGSDNIIDWKKNFQFERTEYPHGSGKTFHTGFLAQYLSVKHEVMEKIERVLVNHKTLDKIDKILFIGHSAGGQCTIAAYDLREFIRTKHGLDMEVITFGSPRLCNSEFEKDFESSIECTRFVNDRDIVTRFPIQSVGGYRHLGNAIQFRKNKIIFRDTSALEALFLLLRGVPKLDVGVKDHDIGEYIKNIEKWMENKA